MRQKENERKENEWKKGRKWKTPDEREDIDWERLRLPLRQKARTCTQNKHRFAIHAVSRFEHSSLVWENQDGQCRRGTVRDNTSTFKSRSLLEHSHALVKRKWRAQRCGRTEDWGRTHGERPTPEAGHLTGIVRLWVRRCLSRLKCIGSGHVSDYITQIRRRRDTKLRVERRVVNLNLRWSYDHKISK